MPLRSPDERGLALGPDPHGRVNAEERSSGTGGPIETAPRYVIVDAAPSDFLAGRSAGFLRKGEKRGEKNFLVPLRAAPRRAPRSPQSVGIRAAAVARGIRGRIIDILTVPQFLRTIVQ